MQLKGWMNKGGHYDVQMKGGMEKVASMNMGYQGRALMLK